MSIGSSEDITRKNLDDMIKLLESFKARRNEFIGYVKKYPLELTVEHKFRCVVSCESEIDDMIHTLENKIMKFTMNKDEYEVYGIMTS